MKKILCNTFVFLISFSATAYDLRKPLIQSATSEADEYQAFLSLNADYMSYSKYMLLKLDNQSINNQITQMYLNAQKYYFEKRFYQALKIYQKIIGLRNKFHFSLHNKKLIINSLIKAHELTANTQQQKKYIEIVLSSYPYISLDEINLGKNLEKTINESSLLFNEWTIGSQFHKYNYLVINGKVHDIFPDKKIKLPKKEFIITLYSDTFYPIQKVTTISELNQWEPAAEWLNDGVCETPQLKVNKSLIKSYIFYDHNCVINYKNENKTQHNLTKNENKSVVKVGNLKIKNSFNETNLPYRKQNNFKWIKNKWLWIGLGAIATTIALSSKGNKNTKKQRTKNGF